VEVNRTDPEYLMGLAIQAARDGIQKGQSPFGCAIAIGDRVLSRQHNTVWQTTDATAHAEINAIRYANREYGSIHLAEAIVATTCEPCPMCMTGLHWARVAKVYYGATIADAADAGFNELFVSAAQLLGDGRSEVILSGDCLRNDCVALFAEWQGHNPRAY
jgi:tRNA(Arg) A34 adenosine deaminase TadA